MHKKAIIDLNGLIGFQNFRFNPIITKLFEKNNIIIIVSDHTLLESMRGGYKNVERILLDIAPYSDKMRIGRLHDEMYKFEITNKTKIHPNHILSADGRSECFQSLLLSIQSGNHPIRDNFKNKEILKELNLRLGYHRTAGVLNRHYNSLDKAIKRFDKMKNKVNTDRKLYDKFRDNKFFGKTYIELCIKLAQGSASKDLQKRGASEDIRNRLSLTDSFAFRRSLSYWLRCLMLRRNNLLSGWIANKVSKKLKNEHFDIEFAAFASYSDIIINSDSDSIEHLRLFERAMKMRFGYWKSPKVFNPSAIFNKSKHE